MASDNERYCKELPMAKIAILIEKTHEDLELRYPGLRLKEAGHTVDMIGPNTGETFIGIQRPISPLPNQ
jgi:putative intracellular protease/amidase